MWHLENKIVETGLVTAIHPHRDTDSIGRWNLLIHKDNLRKTFTAVQSILDNYNSIVPDDPTVRSTWEHIRRVGNGKQTLADEDSNGDQSYATLSMASLSTILTTEDKLTSVTTTNTSFDLTTMEVTVPSIHLNPPMNYLQAVSGNNPSANEIRLQALVEQVAAEYEALKAVLIASKLNVPHAQPSEAASTTDTNTTSTLTNISLLEARQCQQAEHQA